MKNNHDIENFFSIFFVFILAVVVLLAAISGVRMAEEEYIEPLSTSQQQKIVMQIGIDGYKHLVKVKCYQSIVVRIRTERWNDQYCAKSYKHLDFGAIKNG